MNAQNIFRTGTALDQPATAPRGTKSVSPAVNVSSRPAPSNSVTSPSRMCMSSCRGDATALRRAIDLADKAAGKDPARAVQLDELRVLVIDEVDEMFNGLTEAAPKGYAFVHATSGGEGLDRISSGTFHYAVVAEDVSDLPAKTVARTIRNQHPDTVVLTFLGPADNGRVELVEMAGTRSLISPFNDVTLMVDRLDQLAEAWRVKARERRYTQAFRERHYDFLRRYVELKTKIERAINEGPG